MSSKDFVKEYHEIVERALKLSEKARSEGFLAIEDLIDEDKYNQRDVLELGLRLVVDGTDPTLVDKILTNIIDLETDTEIKVLKTIKKEAVLSLQSGNNPRLMAVLLNSYVDIENESAMKQYNYI
jgi:flagellar motor component MotA